MNVYLLVKKLTPPDHDGPPVFIPKMASSDISRLEPLKEKFNLMLTAEERRNRECYIILPGSGIPLI